MYSREMTMETPDANKTMTLVKVAKESVMNRLLNASIRVPETVITKSSVRARVTTLSEEMSRAVRLSSRTPPF